jgi:hypothetical protein
MVDIAVGRADETDVALALESTYALTMVAEETDTAFRPNFLVTNDTLFYAWTFKQDDHEFYGLQLGLEGTLVWDKLTGQWAQWNSPTFGYWRAADVCDWEGYNLAGDTESGILWQIDPLNRLDYGDTPIQSKITGYLTYRMRNNIPCFMAQLALKTGDAPFGFNDGSVGITLRTSVDNGQSFINHGEVSSGGVGEKIAVRWYGLGLMKAPGMYFELTDSGYSRRIDGLNIETSEEGAAGMTNGGK